MTAEVVRMFAQWWDNFQESCDIRLAAGAGGVAAWVLLVAVSPVLSVSPTLTVSGPSWRPCIALGAAIMFGATAIAGSPKLLRAERTLPHLPFLVAGAVLSFAGIVLHHSSDAIAITVVAALCTGGGLAALVLGWVPPFASIRLRKRVVGTVVTAFAGAALYLLVVMIPSPANLGAALALLAASPLLASQIDSPDAISSAAVPSTAIPPRLFGPELSAGALVFGILFVLAGHVLPDIEHAWMASPVPGMINVALFLILETALTLYMVRRVRRESPTVAYRPVIIFAALGFLLLPFVDERGALLCMAVSFAGFGCFLVYFWIVMGNICQHRHSVPIATYGFGLFLIFIGFLIGEAACQVLYSLPHEAFSYAATISILSLFLLVVLAWSMTDGARFAQETAEMGGIPFAMNGAGAEKDSAEHDSDTSADRIAQAAILYNLSPRETEVVELLLRGRSIPYICDELFIAKSTAQTHVRHIYAKMSITGGRQELIDRIESADEVQRPSPPPTA